LVIVHYHLRPGGVRRVIELAVPHLLRTAPQPITRIVLATGEAADRPWRELFVAQAMGVPVQFVVEPAWNYLSEQRGSPRQLTTRTRRALAALLEDGTAQDSFVWAHNLGVGRNLLLSRELAAACAARRIPLICHHHDWWFENRWARWPEMRAAGFRTLGAAARAIFPPHPGTVHTAINRADAAVLTRHFRKGAVWLPNLAERPPQPAAARVSAARLWLARKVNRRAPVWLLPCRILRRKNIAEALLLARWLRPEAWLVVTAAASSAGELPYFRALESAARQHRWPLRLGVLAGRAAGRPGVAELLAASEAVLLTSVQEGFGLPYLEAAAMQRPLIARRLPNISPDLHRFGFRFPQAYDDLLIAPGLFDWDAERARQRGLFADWCAAMPAMVRKHVPTPAVLAASRARPMPFSRLTLTAQTEVLARPVSVSWEACAPLNPFLVDWRRRAAAGRLQVTPWPPAAGQWLDGPVYARRLFAALSAARRLRAPAFAPEQVQADFLHSKLAAHNLHPILWSSRT
jgi:hypothetical protein